MPSTHSNLPAMRTFSTFLVFALFACPLAAQSVRYVSQSATGSGDGSTWADAFTDLHSALAAAQPGDEVWVREGVYRPAQPAGREAVFAVQCGTRLRGGFAGGETDPAQRDPAAHPTVLDGDIGQTGNDADNCYHVLRAEGCDSSTLIEALTLRRGRANGPLPWQWQGGGLLLYYPEDGTAQTPRVRDCTFEQNRATYGAGLAVLAEGGVLPALDAQGCRFSRNLSQRDGGGLFAQGAVAAGQRFSLRGCTFEDNRCATGEGGGAALFEVSGEVEVEGCLFLRDSTKTGFMGGGLILYLNQSNGTLSIVNSVFEGCYAAGGSGATIFDNGINTKNYSILIMNSSFISNKALNEGGGFLSINGLNSTTNIIWEGVDFVKNTGGSIAAGAAFENNGASTYLLTCKNTRFIENDGGESMAMALSIVRYGIGNATNKVIFQNSIFSKNTGAYSITSTGKNSTRFVNCLFSENGQFVLNKNWSSEFDYVSKYNIMDIQNSVIIDTAALQHIFLNNSFAPYTLHDYHVDNCLLSKPDCFFEGQSPCGAGMLYDLDPAFEEGTFVPKPCSPLVNAGDNAWLDTLDIATDLAGNARVAFDTVDIGAYEAAAACVSGVAPVAAEAASRFRALQNPLGASAPLVLVAEGPMRGAVAVEVFDALGRRCASGAFPPGDNQTLRLSPLPHGGVFWVRVRVGGTQQSLRVASAGF
jgi:hypothetical protein